MQCFDYDKKTELESATKYDTDIRESGQQFKSTSEAIQAAVRQFITVMNKRLVTSIFMATDRTIRALGERVQNIDPVGKKHGPNEEDTADDLFQIEFELYNNQLRFTPDAYEVQDAFKEILMLILDVPKYIPLWNAKGDYYDHVLQ